MAHFYWNLDPLSLIIWKKKRCQSWTPVAKLSGSAHADPDEKPPYVTVAFYFGLHYLKSTCTCLPLSRMKMVNLFVCFYPY